MLWTTIRKTRNHCQGVDNCRDEDHCQYHLGMTEVSSLTVAIDTVRLETSVSIESTVRMEMSMQMIKTSGLP